MYPLITDSQFNSIALVLIAVVGIVPATLSAYWSRKAKNNSEETAAEIRTNGGMTDPNPNVNDHIKYQTEMLEQVLQRLDKNDQVLGDHLRHSKVMDEAVADLYLYIKPPRFPKEEDMDQS